MRFCSDILDNPGRAVQAGISKVVAAIGRLRKDQLYEPEIIITQARAGIAQEFGPMPASPSDEAISKPNPEMEKLLYRGRGFDADYYSKPVGWPVLLVVQIFFFLAWIFVELG